MRRVATGVDDGKGAVRLGFRVGLVTAVPGRCVAEGSGSEVGPGELGTGVMVSTVDGPGPAGSTGSEALPWWVFAVVSTLGRIPGTTILILSPNSLRKIWISRALATTPFIPFSTPSFANRNT